MRSRFFIDNVGISKVNMATALSDIDSAIIRGQLGYICAANARTTFIANRDSDYCHIQNHSLLTLPDGKPLVWMAHLKGFGEVGRASGPELMRSILDLSNEKHWSHYFFGGSQNAIRKIGEKMQREYPNLEIRGAVSPPYQPLEAFNIQELAYEINRLKPTFFWCGLGSPKQDRLIALLQPLLRHTICIGVGLAFDFFAGTVRIPPPIFSRLSLDWIYRLIQQPEKWIRFLRPFTFISLHLGGALIRSLFRKANT